MVGYSRPSRIICRLSRLSVSSLFCPIYISDHSYGQTFSGLLHKVLSVDL